MYYMFYIPVRVFSQSAEGPWFDPGSGQIKDSQGFWKANTSIIGFKEF